MPPTDEQCVRSCLDGHPEAFRHLVARYETPLQRHLRFHLGDAERASEAAQETFVRAYFALGELRKPEAFFSWLFGIADRVAKETYRAVTRRQTVGLDRVEPTEIVDTREAGGEGGDREVQEAVSRLPETYREVILLRFFAARSCVEISGDLGVPLGTVTKRLSRAYALLREQIGKIRRGADSEVSP